MARTIDGMIEALEAYRQEIEGQVVGGASTRLQAIFDRASAQLYEQRELLGQLLTDRQGYLERTPENLERAADIVAETRDLVEAELVRPGRAWTRTEMARCHVAGRQLARINVDVEYVGKDIIQAVFDNVHPVERAVLKVGYQSTYRIMATVGEDIGEWFERELLNGVVEGIPVVSKTGGDSLMRRLYESGRLRPHYITTADGKRVRRSVKQRAEAIARIETNRVINRTHEVLAERACGAQVVYADYGPMDGRTTEVCREAHRQDAMSKAAWDASQWGRPPRMNPFHLCRHYLVGGLADWFERRAA